MNYLAYLAELICKYLFSLTFFGKWAASVSFFGKKLADSALWIGWLCMRPSKKLAVRSVVGCKPHSETTTLCAALEDPHRLRRNFGN